MRTRAEISDENIRQLDASLIFVKLRKMIASDTQPTDTILGTIAVAAHTLTGATGAAIAMPRDGAVLCVGRSGETAPELGDELDVDSGISGECMRTGVIMRCDDANRDYHVDAEVCRQLGLRSIAVVPLRGQQGRVGVLEAFSTQAYAFSEDKMDILGRLAGLAEAAWARGAVTEFRAAAAQPAIEIPVLEPEDTESSVLQAEALESKTLESEAIETEVLEPEAPTDLQEPLVEAQAAQATPTTPLAQVREVFATLQKETPPAREKWRYAIMATAGVLVLALLSFYGWKVWYRASVSSRASRSSATQRIVPGESQNSAPSARLVPGNPDVVRPVSRSVATSPGAKPTAVIGMAGAVVQRRPRSPSAAGTEGTEAAQQAAPATEEAPQIAGSNADPGNPGNDLGKVLSTSPTLPKLGVPISQGVSGGVLVRKVQPVYPPEARRMHVEGKVVLEGIVTVQGEVSDLKLVSGEPVLAQAAMEAVRQWHYTPYSLNGQPIPKQTRITISFIAPQ